MATRMEQRIEHYENNLADFMSWKQYRAHNQGDWELEDYLDGMDKDHHGIDEIDLDKITIEKKTTFKELDIFEVHHDGMPLTLSLHKRVKICRNQYGPYSVRIHLGSQDIEHLKEIYAKVEELRGVEFPEDNSNSFAYPTKKTYQDGAELRIGDLYYAHIITEPLTFTSHPNSRIKMKIDTLSLKEAEEPREEDYK